MRSHCRGICVMTAGDVQQESGHPAHAVVVIQQRRAEDLELAVVASECLSDRLALEPPANGIDECRVRGWGMTADDMTPVGVWQDLSEDGAGLRVTGQLADTPRGNELDTLMRMTPRPAIDGLSIGYIPKKYEPRSKPEDPRRRITQIDLIEISLVTFSANRNARISSIKSIVDMDSITELEDLLRDAGGFSRSEAKSIIARIKGHDLRDAEQHLQRMHAAAQRIITNFTTQGK